MVSIHRVYENGDIKLDDDQVVPSKTAKVIVTFLETLDKKNKVTTQVVKKLGLLYAIYSNFSGIEPRVYESFGYHF